VDTANRVVEFNTAFTELCGESYRKVLKIGDFCSLVKTEKCPDLCPAREVITNGKAIRLRLATMNLRIASIVVSRGLVLLTRNVGDFGRVGSSRLRTGQCEGLWRPWLSFPAIMV